MQKKQKVMIFKCVGSFVKNAPNCNESITTNINDDRINKSGGYETELWGEKRYFPTSRQFTCYDCQDFNTRWEEQVRKSLWKELQKHF